VQRRRGCRRSRGFSFRRAGEDRGVAAAARLWPRGRGRWSQRDGVVQGLDVGVVVQRDVAEASSGRGTGRSMHYVGVDGGARPPAQRGGGVAMGWRRGRLGRRGLAMTSRLQQRHGVAELRLGEDGSRRRRCLGRSSGELGWRGDRRNLTSRAPRGSTHLRGWGEGEWRRRWGKWKRAPAAMALIGRRARVLGAPVILVVRAMNGTRGANRAGTGVGAQARGLERRGVASPRASGGGGSWGMGASA
jgi:hypothetical protein